MDLTARDLQLMGNGGLYIDTVDRVHRFFGPDIEGASAAIAALQAVGRVEACRTYTPLAQHSASSHPQLSPVPRCVLLLPARSHTSLSPSLRLFLPALNF